jgi:NMD protein affecting ribosome stability and mRNA decay
MTTIATTCKTCGQEFAPDRWTILAGTWRVCATCRTENGADRPAASCRCERCGRPLRAGTRTLCYRCLVGDSPL